MSEARIAQLLEFLKREPEDAFLNYALAMEYKGAGENERALSILEHIRSIHPGYGATYYHLGKLYLEAGDRTKAEDIFKEGIAVTRSNKEQHLLAELQSAYNELLFDDM